MSQQEKGAYFRALKEAGVSFDRHYREYTTEELKVAYDKLVDQQRAEDQAPPPQPQYQQYIEPPAGARVGEPTQYPGYQAPAPGQRTMERHPALPPLPPPVPVAPRNPAEMAGERLNTHSEGQPLRTDELGRVWFQEEVLKPAAPKPRGRRVLDYVETGTKIAEVQNGEYRETFEVAGDMAPKAAQVKITLPSYQVGIFKDPRFPFRTVCYGGEEGFDLMEVRKYYGGTELVPEEVKTKYVANVLCYDIRTVIRAIQTEFRTLQLQGKV